MYILSNPGFYEVEALSALIALSMVLVIVDAILAVALLIVIASELPTVIHKDKRSKTAIKYFQKLLALLLLFTASGAGALSVVTADERNRDKLESAYTESVIDWLSEGYGIEFEADNVEALLEGNPFTVDYAGELTSVNIQPGPNDELSLVDQERTVLPLNR